MPGAPATPRSKLTVAFRAERSLIALAQREVGKTGPRMWLFAEGLRVPANGPLLSELPDSESKALQLCAHALDHRGVPRLYIVEDGFVVGPLAVGPALQATQQHMVCITEELFDARRRLPQQCSTALMDILSTHARRHLKAKKQRQAHAQARLQARGCRCGTDAAASLDFLTSTQSFLMSARSDYDFLTSKGSEEGEPEGAAAWPGQGCTASRLPAPRAAARPAHSSLPAPEAGDGGPGQKGAQVAEPLGSWGWLECVRRAVEACSATRLGGAPDGVLPPPMQPTPPRPSSLPLPLPPPSRLPPPRAAMAAAPGAARPTAKRSRAASPAAAAVAAKENEVPSVAAKAAGGGAAHAAGAAAPASDAPTGCSRASDKLRAARRCGPPPSCSAPQLRSAPAVNGSLSAPAAPPRPGARPQEEAAGQQQQQEEAAEAEHADQPAPLLPPAFGLDARGLSAQLARLRAAASKERAPLRPRPPPPLRPHLARRGH